MLSVRPDRVGVMRTLFLDEQHEAPRDHAPSPYFMDNLNTKKYFVSGELKFYLLFTIGLNLSSNDPITCKNYVSDIT